MALDGVFLSYVCGELSCLIDGRIDKIYQPSKEELILGFRTRDGSYRLLINSSAGSARVHLTNAEIENPKTPPMFCMLMRKRLASARLTAIRQDGFERIISFDFDAQNEFGDRVKLTLCAEIMGRRSNIILIDDSGRIIDSIKRVTPEMSSVRQVLPGIKYTAPPRAEKLSLSGFDAGSFRSGLRQYENKRISDALIRTIEGISPVFADECAYFAAHELYDKSVSDLSDDELDRLCFYLSEASRNLESKKAVFTAIKTPEGQFKDFCFTQIRRFGTLMVTKEYDGACELLDEFYKERGRIERLKQSASDLFRLLSVLEDRIIRRISVQKEELANSVQRDSFRLSGDLIMTNMYMLEKGMKSFKCQNYFSETCEETEIALDPGLTPQQNAQKYYKMYKKAAAAEKKLTELIENGERETLYIDSVFDSLTRAESQADVEQLREELAEQGYIRSRKRKTGSQKALPPLKFRSSDGFTILVGRHNRQNDKLTLKDSQKTDVWLHTHNTAGSHAVIRADGEEIPDTTLMQAARIAALHSKAKDGSQVPVDYTLIRYVRKPNGAKPGMVIFTNQKTVYVKPDEEEAARLRVR